MRTLAIIGAVFASIVTVIVLVVGGFALDWFTTPIRGKLQARHTIYSGDYRIQAYDHFFNLCAAVQTDETRLDAQNTELASTKNPDDQDRIRANIAGITADRQDAINTYNADAQKDYTLGQFRASKLPFQLPTGPYQEGVHTQCAV